MNTFHGINNKMVLSSHINKSMCFFWDIKLSFTRLDVVKEFSITTWDHEPCCWAQQRVFCFSLNLPNCWHGHPQRPCHLSDRCSICSFECRVWVYSNKGCKKGVTLSNLNVSLIQVCQNYVIVFSGPLPNLTNDNMLSCMPSFHCGVQQTTLWCREKKLEEEKVPPKVGYPLLKWTLLSRNQKKRRYPHF